MIAEDEGALPIDTRLEEPDEIRQEEEAIRQRMRGLFDQYLAAEDELRKLEAGSFRVCIFGSARIGPADPTYQMVRKLAKTLAGLGIDVVTGGGPGLMEAANQGERDAHAAGTLSIGVPILMPHRQELPNSHLDIKSEHRRFSSRLDEFMRLSHATIVAPGGIGTLLELSYTWQLIQVQMIAPRAVVLLGRSFWSGLLAWMNDQQLRRRFIEPPDLQFVHLADTEAEVLSLIRPELEKFRAGKHATGQHQKADEADTIIHGMDKAQESPEHQQALPGTSHD